METRKIMMNVSTIPKPFFKLRWWLVFAVNAVLLPLKLKPWTPARWLYRFEVELAK